MAWAAITILEVSPGARILASLMTRIRDNQIWSCDQGSAGVPTSERPRVPECLRCNQGNVTTALGSGGVGTPCVFFSTPKWHLSAFQTPGAWSITGSSARTYLIEMWGAGAGGDGNAGRRGGGSSGYQQLTVAAGAGVAIGGVIGTGGTTAIGVAGNAGGDTTLATGPGTATVYGAPAGGAGGAAPIFGGGSSLIFSTAGVASSAFIASAGSEGAPAPFIGGSSAQIGSFLGTPPTMVSPPGHGGSASPNVGGIIPPRGGDGMVLVWYLE